MKNEETKSTKPMRLIVKIAIAVTAINTWILFEEIVVDRYGLWRYMPYYRVGLFCVWDAAVLAVTLLLLLVGVARSRRPSGPTVSTTPPLPLIVKIAVAMTFLGTLVILFVWPGVLLRICFRSAASRCTHSYSGSICASMSAFSFSAQQLNVSTALGV
jgi:hypothetical protein